MTTSPAPSIATGKTPGWLGWHVVVYFEAVDLPELWDFFTGLPTIVVVDHMGRPDVSQPVDGPQFERFIRLMREHENVWSKVSCPERLSASGPPALNGRILGRGLLGKVGIDAVWAWDLHFDDSTAGATAARAAAQADGIRAPMLLGGAQAEAVAEQLRGWGMEARAVSAQHGQRRAEEKREAARTVQEGGFEPLMTAAIARKQAWVAQQAHAGIFDGLDGASPWQDYADWLIGRSTP